MFYIEFFIYYWLAINVVAFITYGVDKWKAIHQKWRIPEATLLLLAAIGGSIGALLGMFVWRHKTRHLKFLLGVPAILAIQFELLLYVYTHY